MVKLRKNNVVLRVEEKDVQKYLNDGYSLATAPEIKKEKVTIAPKVKDAIEEDEEEEQEVAPKVNKGKK